jgi:hypothetical protein
MILTIQVFVINVLIFVMSPRHESVVLAHFMRHVKLFRVFKKS